MEVYFIRHGQTTDGNSGKHQLPTSELSTTGNKEAEILADRIKDIDFDLLISSSFTRARQTADIINKYHHKDIIETDLLIETKRPSEILGLTFDDPKRQEIEIACWENRFNTTFRYSDEETIAELLARARRALDLIESHTVKRVLVVSHGDIMRAMMTCMMYEEHADQEKFVRWREFAHSRHTGVTLCRLETHIRSAGRQRWFLVSWNDHAHLHS